MNQIEVVKVVYEKKSDGTRYTLNREWNEQQQGDRGQRHLFVIPDTPTFQTVLKSALIPIHTTASVTR